MTKKFGRLTLLEFSHKNGNHIPYWKVKCDCGTSKIVRLDKMRYGETVSCGCYGRERVKEANKGRRMPKISRQKNMLFSYFKGEANRRDLPFNLSKEECFKLSQAECFYCGGGPSNEMSMYKRSDPEKFKYSGIDRVDNELGYEGHNVVPCCEKCNKAKRMLSQNEFFDLVRKIYCRRFKK